MDPSFAEFAAVSFKLILINGKNILEVVKE